MYSREGTATLRPRAIIHPNKSMQRRIPGVEERKVASEGLFDMSLAGRRETDNLVRTRHKNTHYTFSSHTFSENDRQKYEQA